MDFTWRSILKYLQQIYMTVDKMALPVMMTVVMMVMMMKKIKEQEKVSFTAKQYANYPKKSMRK